jgi:glutathione S-transferase
MKRGRWLARPKLTLISHKLCPYVQRAVIALTEKGVPFERIDIDLANKPDWFLKISPLGKVPVLLSQPMTARWRCSRAT